jgi:hypothetical protein
VLVVPNPPTPIGVLVVEFEVEPVNEGQAIHIIVVGE